MTRSVAFALSTLGAASIATAADFPASPQPSFADYVVYEASDASAGSSAFEAVSDEAQPLPAPSFIDTGTPDGDYWNTHAVRSGVIVAESSPQRLPGPSFFY